MLGKETKMIEDEKRKIQNKLGEKNLGDRLLSVALLDRPNQLVCLLEIEGSSFNWLTDLKDSTPNLIDRWSPCDANVKRWTLHQPQFFFIFYFL